MMHVVLKPFPFAGNGYTHENLKTGDERHFGKAAAGLIAEGYIGEIGAVAVETTAKPEVEPEDEAQPETEETPRRGRPRK